MRINKLLTNGYELTEEEKANLKVTLQDVIGEIQSEESYWRPFVNGTNGNLYWEWDTSPTGNTPAQRKILYWPAFSADPENSHLLWKLDDDESWTDLNITTSGAQGPQGDPGQKGADGTSIRLVGTKTVAGGTQVTFGWGTSDTSAFVIPSGAAGANGTNGVSPTVELTEIQDPDYPQGGWNVKITDAEHQSGQTFQIFNGIDGQDATVDLVEGNGIQITHQSGTTDYTIGVSADYALKSELPDVRDMATQTWVEEQRYLTSIPDSYATKTYANEASAYALSQAETWVEEQRYLTSIPDSYATKTYANEASAYALSQAETWVEEQRYLPTSGGTVSGQLVVSGKNNDFDNYFLKIIGENVNGFARLGLGQFGGLALKIDDANQHVTQVNIRPNESNDQLIQVQHDGGTVGYLIPATTATTTAGLTNDGILHIILES